MWDHLGPWGMRGFGACGAVWGHGACGTMWGHGACGACGAVEHVGPSGVMGQVQPWGRWGMGWGLLLSSFVPSHPVVTDAQLIGPSDFNNLNDLNDLF